MRKRKNNSARKPATRDERTSERERPGAIPAASLFSRRGYNPIMQRGSTGHMLFVIAAGLVSLAVCMAIGVALIRFAHYALGDTVTAILLAVLFVVWLRQWWKRKMEEYEDYASKNEIEYLEELADEHERGVKDRAKQLRFLLSRFGERNPKAREQYKSRLDNIRGVIGTPFVSNAELLAKLQKEIQPEMDRMQAEHERVMRLIAQMPGPSEGQKRAIAEANSPAGWQRAMREVIEQAKQSSYDPKRRKSSNPTPDDDSEV